MQTLAVVTGTRAEYGLLRPVLQKLQNHPRIQCKLLVTGAHLSEQYGETVKEIENDNLPIAKRIDILAKNYESGRLGTAQKTAYALECFIQEFSADKPDAVLLLGDRYEIFAVAQAAALLDIPVIHISGGDVTFGADDDWFRHCITKMAKLHFPSCEEYRQRILRMGEMPNRVFNVGGLGDENIRGLELLTFPQLEESLGIKLPRPYALVTFHPETATNTPVEIQIQEFISAIQQQKGIFYLVTKANADAGGDLFNKEIQLFCEKNDNCALFSSLGVLRYLSAMKYANFVLGNSSSGVVETPSFGTPTVNVGDRQTGRIMCGNVLNCELKSENIANAIEKVLSVDFIDKAKREVSPYFGGDTSGKIITHIDSFLHSGELKAPKIFYDGENLL